VLGVNDTSTTLQNINHLQRVVHHTASRRSRRCSRALHDHDGVDTTCTPIPTTRICSTSAQGLRRHARRRSRSFRPAGAPDRRREVIPSEGPLRGIAMRVASPTYPCRSQRDRPEENDRRESMRRCARRKRKAESISPCPTRSSCRSTSRQCELVHRRQRVYRSYRCDFVKVLSCTTTMGLLESLRRSGAEARPARPVTGRE